MPDPLRPSGGSLGPPPRLDASLPPEMVKRAEEIGVKKASMDVVSMVTLAGLAGAAGWFVEESIERGAVGGRPWICGCSWGRSGSSSLRCWP